MFNFNEIFKKLCQCAKFSIQHAFKICLLMLTFVVVFNFDSVKEFRFLFFSIKKEVAELIVDSQAELRKIDGTIKAINNEIESISGEKEIDAEKRIMIYHEYANELKKSKESIGLRIESLEGMLQTKD